MRIALTHPYSWPEVRRGAERIIVETARALAGRGHDVTVLTAGAASTCEVADGYTTRCTRRVFDDPLRHQQWFGLRILPELARGGFDVVHSLMPYDAAAAIRAQRVAGHLTVYEELGIPAAHWWGFHPGFKTRMFVARNVDVYACMSRYALDAFEREWERPGALIPGGVRLAEFHPGPRETNPTLLFSGALDEVRKGLRVLMEAVALLASRRPSLRLWLSGPGDPSAAMAAAPPEARSRTEVLPLGEPGQQADRYARAWATVLPSTSESFGMVLVESLASGTPIVVAGHAAPPELVTPATGAISAPGDPRSLADAIDAALTLATDPATAERCRSAAAPFDWDGGLAPRLEAIYAG